MVEYNLKNNLKNLIIAIVIIIVICHLFYHINYTNTFYEKFSSLISEESGNILNYLTVGNTIIHSNGSISVGNNTLIKSDGSIKIGSTTIDPTGKVLTFGETLNPIKSVLDLTFPPISNGLIAFYDNRSIQQDKLMDLIGSYNATIVGTPLTTTGNYMKGELTTQIYFPQGILPSGYTLFTLAKYNGPNKKNIFTASNGSNWFSGFRDGAVGIAYHDTWITKNPSGITPTDWLLSTDQKSLYRGNKKTLSTETSTTSSITLAINPPNSIAFGGEQSDFAIRCIIVYGRELSLSEINVIEGWITSIYGTD